MLDNRHNPWYYFIPVTLGVIVGSVVAWLFGASPVAGGIIGAAALVIGFIIFGGPAKPTGSAYSLALPALLMLQLPVVSWQLGAAIGLLVLAYLAKAAIDTLTHQAGNNIFEKWGPWFDARTSWLNKYKPGSWPAAPVPRFLGSTTVFAWLTDFWHAADSVYLTAYLLGGMLLGAWLGASGAWPWVLAVALVKAGGGGVFQGCYRLFRTKQ